MAWCMNKKHLKDISHYIFIQALIQPHSYVEPRARKREIRTIYIFRILFLFFCYYSQRQRSIHSMLSVHETSYCRSHGDMSLVKIWISHNTEDNTKYNEKKNEEILWAATRKKRKTAFSHRIIGSKNASYIYIYTIIHVVLNFCKPY